MSKQKKRMGRPPVENPATERLPMIRITPDQLEIYREAAEREGLAFSAWVRKVLDRAANRVLK